tara:strand:- start:593 stop:1054 length:462 start_codon:yes stop_codon:yes gene_type:complete
MDETDLKIIGFLQTNALMSVSEIADKIELSVSSCWNRIRRLEEVGIIRKRVTILDGKKINLPIVVFLTISVNHHTKDFHNLISAYKEVIEVWRLSGEFDYLLKVVSESLNKYDEFIKKIVNEFGFIRSYNSNIVLNEIKYTTSYPLDHLSRSL